MYCKNCGSEIKKEERVCPNCGKKNPDHMDTKIMKIGFSIAGVVIIALIVSVINGVEDNNYNKPVSSSSSISSSNSNDSTSPTSDNNTTEKTSGVQSSSKSATTNNSNTSSQGNKIGCKELYDAYNDNEVSANNKYSGKQMTVTGKILRITVDGGKPTIELSEDADDMMGDVICYFNKNSSDSNKIANLKKGQTVSIKGIVGEKGFVGVPIDNCSL